MEIKITFKSKPKLVFNGREYASVDEMPEDVRRLYRDAIALAARGGSNVKVLSHTELWFNGKKYGSADEMPPDVRVVYDGVTKKIDANQRRSAASPGRSLFSVVSTASLIILLVWLVIIILRRV
jgi:hypothetical protein